MPDFRFAGDDTPPTPTPPSTPEVEDTEAKQRAAAHPVPPNIPLPVAPPVAPGAPLEDPVTADEVFAGLSPRIRNRPHVPPPGAPPAATQKPAAPEMPEIPSPTPPVIPQAKTAQPGTSSPAPAPAPAPAPSSATRSTPPAPRPPASAEATAARTPAVPRTPGAPRTPATPNSPATPAAPRAASPQAPSPQVPSPRVPSPAIPTTAIPPGMTPHAMHDAPHAPDSAPQFSHTHRDSSDWTEEITKFAPAASTVVNISVGIAALAAALLAFLIFSGRAEQVANMGNVNTAAAFINIGAVAAAAGLIVSQWSSRSVGFGLVIAGLIFMAGVPAFIPAKISSISSLFQGGGFFLLLLGLIKIGLDFAIGQSAAESSARGNAARSSERASGSPQGAVILPSAPGQAPPAGPTIGVQIVNVPGAPSQGHAAHAHGAPAPPTGHHPRVASPTQDTDIIDDGDQISALRRAMESVDPIATWVFRIAAFFAAASFLYLLFGIFAGRIGQPGVAPAIANNIKLAAVVFQWSSVLLALSGVWLALDMSYLGLALIALGLGIHFGAPWVLLGHVGQTNLVTALAGTLRTTGFALAMVGLLKQGYEILQWALDLPNRMKQKADVGFAQQAEPAQRRVAKQANMMSPCWQLPFCRETIRKQCPAFLAKKTCWKFGRGCYCDEEMIGRIIRGEALDVIKAPTRLSRTGKPPCGRCHIYLEHQGFKFKMLSPLAFPLTVLIMYFIWPFYSMAFAAFSNSPVWNALNFDTSKITPDAIATKGPGSQPVSSISDEQVVYFATILIGVLLGFFVLVYVSKFIEWAIYKAKL